MSLYECMTLNWDTDFLNGQNKFSDGVKKYKDYILNQCPKFPIIFVSDYGQRHNNHMLMHQLKYNHERNKLRNVAAKLYDDKSINFNPLKHVFYQVHKYPRGSRANGLDYLVECPVCNGYLQCAALDHDHAVPLGVFPNRNVLHFETTEKKELPMHLLVMSNSVQDEVEYLIKGKYNWTIREPIAESSFKIEFRITQCHHIGDKTGGYYTGDMYLELLGASTSTDENKYRDQYYAHNLSNLIMVCRQCNMGMGNRPVVEEVEMDTR